MDKIFTEACCFKSKDHRINIFTFDEFVDYVKRNSDEPHWSCMFRGKPVTHETDSLYLIHTGVGGDYLRLHRDECLCLRNDESIFTLLKSDVFEQMGNGVFTYETGVLSVDNKKNKFKP